MLRLRRSTRISVTSALGLALVLASSSVAFAQSQNKAAAEELFQLGKAAMEKKDYAKACKAFQESLDAELTNGTLLNLALCHEQAGKLASAWSDYRALEDRARQASPPQADRAKFAHDKAEALRPRLSRVKITLSPEAKALTGLTVKIDGTVAPPELFEAGIPVDTGKRAISASAADHEEWSQTVSVDADKQTLDVTVPMLKAKEVAPAPVTKADPVTVKPAEPAKSSEGGDYRAVGYVVGGIGAAALATGAVFGVLALGKKNDAKCEEVCINPSTKLSDARDAYNTANTFGWISNIAIAAGVIGVGVGTILVLTSAHPFAERRGDRRCVVKRRWPVLGALALATLSCQVIMGLE